MQDRRSQPDDQKTDALEAGRPARINYAPCSHHRHPVGQAAITFPPL